MKYFTVGHEWRKIPFVGDQLSPGLLLIFREAGQYRKQAKQNGECARRPRYGRPRKFKDETACSQSLAHSKVHHYVKLLIHA